MNCKPLWLDQKEHSDKCQPLSIWSKEAKHTRPSWDALCTQHVPSRRCAVAAAVAFDSSSMIGRRQTSCAAVVSQQRSVGGGRGFPRTGRMMALCRRAAERQREELVVSLRMSSVCEDIPPPSASGPVRALPWSRLERASSLQTCFQPFFVHILCALCCVHATCQLSRCAGSGG